MVRSNACDVGNLTGGAKGRRRYGPGGCQRGHSDDRIRSGLGHDMPDVVNGRGLGNANQALKFSVRAEEVVATADEVRNRHASIGEDGH